MSALQIKQLPVNGYMPNLQRRKMNCPNKDCWLDTVVDGRCSVCGEPSENTKDTHLSVTEYERKVEDEPTT